MLCHPHQALSLVGGVLLYSIFRLVRHICQMEVGLCCAVLRLSYLLRVLVDQSYFVTGKCIVSANSSAFDFWSNKQPQKER